jgi:pumilio family protein 6
VTSSKKQKTEEAKSAPKTKQRRHSDVVEESKRLWNKLRVKTNTPEQTRALMDQLMPLIQNKVHEIALQHDASRIVQAAIQFGTSKEQQTILQELHPHLVELSKSQYAHFTVLKLIKYCKDKESLEIIVKSFRGEIPKLAVHAVASRVIEALFLAHPKQTAVLKQEFYGPHFSLFATQQQLQSIPTLQSNLVQESERKEQTLTFLRNLLHKCMEKQLYAYSYVQDLLAEYIEAASSLEIRSIAATAADHAIHLLSTRSGTRVVANLIAYGTPKDRKRIAKSLKGYIRSGLLHTDAYLAILRLVQLTDDTVSMQKNVLQELLTGNNDSESSSSLLELALSDHAHKFFLLLLLDDDKRQKYFDPYEHSVLFPDPTIEEDGKLVPTSKKDASVRRKENLQVLQEPLIQLCSKHARELLYSRSGAIVLREVYSAFCPDSLVQAVVHVVDDALLEDRQGHFAVKSLLLVDVEKKDGSFATQLYAKLQGRLWEVSQSNRGAFVVAALASVPSVRKQVLVELKKDMPQKGCGVTTTAGYAALLNEISGKKTKA